VSVLLAFVAAVLFGAGLYLALSRNVLRLVFGLSMLTTSVNLALFQAGRIRSAQPPLIAEGADRLGESADPVPQALVLTAIVIGFALTVVLVALALRAWGIHRTLRTDRMHAAELFGATPAPEPDHDR
jgi:multicomponent Na+:H+ antiporter subunit C